MRYSLRRAMSLDSVDGCTHNPTIYSCWLDARMVSDEEDVISREPQKVRRNPSHIIPTLVRRARA
jgi:hypothetical protein